MLVILVVYLSFTLFLNINWFINVFFISGKFIQMKCLNQVIYVNTRHIIHKKLKIGCFNLTLRISILI